MPAASPPTPTLALRDGQQIPRLIRGGWQIDTADPDKAMGDLADFVIAGIRCFEVSDSYGGSESLLGQFLGRAADLVGNENAAAIRVHTRYTPDLSAGPPARGRARAAVAQALRRLGQDRLDLLQLQWWDFAVPGLPETGAELAACQSDGMIRGLGVTNFDTAHVRQLTDSGLTVLTNQVQYSLVDRRAASGLADFCESEDIALLGYGPLAGGFLTDRWMGLDDPANADGAAFSGEYRYLIDRFGGWALLQELLDALSDIANRHGVSIANIALRWVLDQERVAAVLVGLSSPARAGETLRALAVTLDAVDRSRIDAILARSEGPPGEVAALERDKTGVLAGIIRASLAAKAG